MAPAPQRSASLPPDEPRGAGPLCPPSAPSPASTCILIVDDEPDLLTALEMLITRSFGNVRVLTAARPNDAVEILTQEPVDFLLTDFNMPEMNGLELWRRAQAIRPHLAGALMSAFAGTFDSQDVAGAGFSATIPKPLDPTELLTLLSSLTRRNVSVVNATSAIDVPWFAGDET